MSIEKINAMTIKQIQARLNSMDGQEYRRCLNKPYEKRLIELRGGVCPTGYSKVTLYDSSNVSTCANGYSRITSWSACKAANTNNLPLGSSFSDDNWPYGCLIINGKLFFNAKTDSKGLISGKQNQKLLCAKPGVCQSSTSSS